MDGADDGEGDNTVVDKTKQAQGPTPRPVLGVGVDRADIEESGVRQ